jgi:hypothetical protein
MSQSGQPFDIRNVAQAIAAPRGADLIERAKLL